MVFGWVGVRGGFCVSSAPEQEDDQQESKKCNERGTGGVA